MPAPVIRMRARRPRGPGRFMPVVPATLGLLALFMLLLGGRGSASGSATERVSVDSNEAQADGNSFYLSISADGRYVAFDSFASNLVAGDTNNNRDVFVRDRQAGTTERVSVDSSGAQGNNSSGLGLAISADGRYVAFTSSASNLVSGDTNTYTDVFVRDRQAGTTERVSVDSNGVQANYESLFPAISADGRYVAFHSAASNLVAGDTNGTIDIFVRDRQAGTTERVSVDSGEAEANNDSYSAAISADGRYVAFSSRASNLVSGDTNNFDDIFVRDRQAGTTERVSVDSGEAEANGYSYSAAISADGQYVAFDSGASNLVSGDTNAYTDVFVRDRQAGTTERVSVDSSEAQGNFGGTDPSISADGGYVAFTSDATNLVPGDTNVSLDIFVRDRQAGTTERVSLDSGGAEGNHHSSEPSISGDGRYVAFQSAASNLVPGDTNNASDIFVRDRQAAGPTPTPTPSPTPTPTASPTPTPTPTPTPSPSGTPGPAGPKGDIDCDGDTDAVDALRILRYVAGLNPNLPPNCEPIGPADTGPKGDMDCDGDVDAVDALRILRYVAGLDPNQPANCEPIGKGL